MQWTYEWAPWVTVLWCSVQLLAGGTGHGVFYPGSVEFGLFRRAYTWKNPVAFRLIMLVNGVGLTLALASLLRA